MKHLRVGDQVPNFTIKDQNGQNISPEQFLGQKWVLYFYPKDLTPTCINQACNIRDNYTSLQKEGVTIFGVSMDEEKLHKRFIDRYDLPFPLLVDSDKKVIEAFGVWGEKKFMGRTFDGIHRTTFLMDEKNTIVGIIDKPKSKIHAQEIMEIYDKLN